MDSGRDVRHLQVTATAVDEGGVVHTAPLRPVEAGPAHYEMPIDGSVRLLSITIHRTSLDSPDEGTFEISSVAADGAPLSLSDWEALTWRGSTGSVEPDGSGSATR